MNIEKVSSDNRGDVFGFELNGRQHILVTFKKGVARGGHYHQTDQWHICLAGKFDVLLWPTEKAPMHIPTERHQFLTEGQSLIIPRGVAHLFIAHEDSVLAESRDGDYEAQDYEPYRNLAKPR